VGTLSAIEPRVPVRYYHRAVNRLGCARRRFHTAVECASPYAFRVLRDVLRAAAASNSVKFGALTDHTPDLLLPCPSCGFLVFATGSYGSYEMCPVCDWEDDGVQLANPASCGGANQESLAEAQDGVLARFPLTMRTHGQFKRSSEWRPLSESERGTFQKQASMAWWPNRGVVDPTQVYWGCCDMKRTAKR
jgi:hypothetical protein